MPQVDDKLHVRDLQPGNKIVLADGVFEIASLDVMDGSNGEAIQFVAGSPTLKMAAAFRINLKDHASLIAHPGDTIKVSLR